MSYIGNPIISTDFPVDYKNGDGSTTAFTLSIAPASVNAVAVTISGVKQSPKTYTVSGTTLTFSAAPPTGTDNIVIEHKGIAGTPNVPSAGSVVATSIADGVITAAKFASGQTPAFNGIAFPATQSASADANTLDDYEEGTWTPSYFGGTTAGTTTYNDTYGRYTKVGRMVTASFSVSIASVTGTGVGRIGNLPFTIGSSAGGSCSVMTRNLNWTDGDTYVIGYVPSDSTSILFYSCRDNSTWNAVPIDGDVDMYATIVYQST